MGEPSDPEIRVAGPGPRSWSRLGAGIIAMGLGAFLVIEVQSAGSKVADGLRLFVLGAGAVFVALALLLFVEAAQGGRPLRLRGNILTIASGTRRRRIPLEDISGVGLLFRWALGRNGLPAGWYLSVWDKEAKPYSVEECALISHWKEKDYLSGNGPTESANELAASDAGKMAKLIYDRAFATQGSGGRLATRQEQKMRATTVWTRDINTYACWSPDGELHIFAEVHEQPTEDRA